MPALTRPRIETLDLLRGFALLGILVMNIQAFALPSAAYLAPRTWGSIEGIEGLAWSVGRVFFDMKFLALFSLLFGASLVLAGDAHRPRRRLAWLLVAGLLHGHLLFIGDILFTYACAGWCVLGARSAPVRRQVQAGLALLAVSTLGMVSATLVFHDLLLESLAPASILAEVEAVRAGGWAAQRVRSELALLNHIAFTLTETGWRAAGWMLLGMAALRAGWLSGTPLPRRAAVVPALPGPACTLTGLWLGWGPDVGPARRMQAQVLHEVGVPGMVFLTATAVVRIAAQPWLHQVRIAVISLGRVALSAYILQSALMVLIFQTPAWPQFGAWSRTALLLLPFAVWGAQVVAAHAWVRRGRQGPLEWLLRRLIASSARIHPHPPERGTPPAA
jgi:uncharacterized protein